MFGFLAENGFDDKTGSFVCLAFRSNQAGGLINASMTIKGAARYDALSVEKGLTEKWAGGCYSADFK